MILKSLYHSMLCISLISTINVFAMEGYKDASKYPLINWQIFGLNENQRNLYSIVWGDIRNLTGNVDCDANEEYTLSPMHQCMFGRNTPPIIPELVACLPSDQNIQLETAEVHYIARLALSKMKDQSERLKKRIDFYNTSEKQSMSDDKHITATNAYSQLQKLTKAIPNPYTQGTKAVVLRHLFNKKKDHWLPPEIQKLIISYMSGNTTRLSLAPKYQKISLYELGLLAQWCLPCINPSYELGRIFAAFSYYQALHNKNWIRFNHGNSQPLYWPCTNTINTPHYHLLPVPFRALNGPLSIHETIGNLIIPASDTSNTPSNNVNGASLYLIKFPHEFSKKEDMQVYQGHLAKTINVQTTYKPTPYEGDYLFHIAPEHENKKRHIKTYIPHKPIQIPTTSYVDVSGKDYKTYREALLESSYYLDAAYKQNITALVQSLHTCISFLKRNKKAIKCEKTKQIPHTQTSYQDVFNEIEKRRSYEKAATGIYGGKFYEKAVEEVCFGSFKQREQIISDVTIMHRTLHYTKDLLREYHELAYYLTQLRDKSLENPHDATFVSAGYFWQ